MNVTGRSRPYDDRNHCGRCGIEPDTRTAQQVGYCTPCEPHARQMGWIE